MQQITSIQATPEEAADEVQLRERILQHTGLKTDALSGFQIQKKSLDARGKRLHYVLSIRLYINETPPAPTLPTPAPITLKQHPPKTIIIGAGPAGLFAALQLLENGIQPIILERGKDVRSRRRDLALLNREGLLHPDSNYCFGEGGAGTYSDGKLYTRSTKRGNVQRILEKLVSFGASPAILFEAHPHIGTNKLPGIITAIRDYVLASGGEVHFEKKVTGFVTKNSRIESVITQDGTSFEAQAIILATGHSARDVFTMLHAQGIRVEAKPFALGVRIEHPQALINRIQYHGQCNNPHLPPASYSVVQHAVDRSLFSFCMCPGGIIATASTDPESLVINGWSPSKRNNPYANSGMVVPVEITDACQYLNKDPNDTDPFVFMAFQHAIEQRAYVAGGGQFKAPAQRLTDFCEKRASTTLPATSYVRGIEPADLRDVLPDFITNNLALGLQRLGKKLKGYYTEEAVLVATESRTSSPVRIPRDPIQGNHPDASNLFPCGEGAGYAGGIMSAAMDGERVAQWVTKWINH